MGSLQKWREWPGPERPRHIILVPGVAAALLEQQTCAHFPKFIETCYAKPNTALTVWVYNHGVTPRERSCWESFYAAGDHLLEKIVATVERWPELDLELIGHRLGVFLLKKALVRAYHSSHRTPYAALFEALQKIIMIGDPYLHDDNRSEWTLLVQSCFQEHKKSSPDVYCEEALDGLKRISDKFEEITLHSQFFQVAGDPLRRKSLRLKRASTHKNCLSNANITFRMWSTADEDDSVPLASGDGNICVFHRDSNGHKPLIQIAAAGLYEPKNTRLIDYKFCSLAGTNSGTHEAALTVAPLRAPEDANGPHLRDPVSTLKNSDEDGPNVNNGVYCYGNPAVCARLGEASFCVLEDSFTVDPERKPGGEDCNSGQAPGHKVVITEDRVTPSNTDEDGTFCADYISSENSTSRETGTVESQGHPHQHKCPPSNGKPEQRVSAHAQQGSGGLSQEKESEDEVMQTRTHPKTARSRPLPLRLAVPPPCKSFVGRAALLESLKTFLVLVSPVGLSNEVITARQRIVILNGMSGVGKTQTARQFVAQNSHHFDNVLWVRSETKASIAQSYHSAAIAIGLVNGRKEYSHKISTAKIKDWLRSNKARWLVVFDDIEDYEDLGPYLPGNDLGLGSILITSRRRPHGEWSFLDTSPLTLDLEVPPFNLEESVELLSVTMPTKPEFANSEEARRIVRLLGGVPLAIAFVGPFIRRNQISMGQLIRGLETESQSTYTSTGSRFRVKHSLEIPRSMFQLTVLKGLSVEAEELCSVLACLDPTDMNESLLLAAAACEVPLQNLPVTEQHLDICRREFEAIVDVWANTSDDRRLYWKHESLQTAFQSSRSQNQTIDALKTTSILLLSRWPSPKKFRHILNGFWPDFDTILKHVRQLSRLWVALCLASMTLDYLVEDEPFMQLLTVSTWYNDKIRGNGEDDAGLHELAHTIYACKSRAGSSSPASSSAASHVPARLLYFDHENKDCRLVETNGRDLSYMALSYIWSSGGRLPRLTHDNYEDFKRGIPFPEIEHLATASTLMEQADIQYLWIDSMCIIHDDLGDRTSEIVKLDKIYAHSKATISCLHSLPAPIPKKRGNTLERIYQFRCLRTSGNYNIYSHGSDSFSQKWFSRIATKKADMFFFGRNITAAGDTSSSSLPIVHQDHEDPNMRSQVDDSPALRYLPQEDTSPLQGTRRGPSIDEARHSAGDEAATPKIEFRSGKHATGAQRAQLNDHKEDRWTPDNSNSRALKLIDEGIEAFKRSSRTIAVSKLFQAREHVIAPNQTSVEALRIHILTSIYVASICLLEKDSDMAEDVVKAARDRLKGIKIRQDHKLLSSVAHLHIIVGNICSASGRFNDAAKLYEETLQITEGAEGDMADFAAIAKIKLAELKPSTNANQALNLIKESSAHFEDQATQRGQSQYARTLYYKALLTADGGRKMANKRARRALEDFCEEFGFQAPPEGELTKEDFERVIELGFV